MKLQMAICLQGPVTPFTLPAACRAKLFHGWNLPPAMLRDPRRRRTAYCITVMRGLCMESSRTMGEPHPRTKGYRRLPLCIGTLLLLAQPALAQDRSCAVAEIAGEASLTQAGGQIRLQIGTDLGPRDLLETGPSGRVEVACSDGTRVTVGPDTQIGLGSLVGAQAGDSSIGMSLHRGIARFLAPVRTWGSFNVFGPVAVASVRSTEWIMETPEGGTNVFVREGEVAVLSKRGDNVHLWATYGVDVAPDGTMGEPKKWGAPRVAKVLARLGLQ